MTVSTKPRIRYRGNQVVRAQYEGASTKRRMAGKGTTVTGPNAPIERNLATLVARSHNAIRNNAYAAAAKEKYISNLVGTGIKPQWGDATIQALWDQWAGECDADGVDNFYGLQSLAAGSQFEAGEALARIRYRRTSDGLSVPMQLQVIEPEHLDPTYSQAYGGRLIKMGIEFNGIGQRSAYHLWRFHPHERLTSEINERVPVPADNVVHMYRRGRPGQHQRLVCGRQFVPVDGDAVERLGAGELEAVVRAVRPGLRERDGGRGHVRRALVGGVRGRVAVSGSGVGHAVRDELLDGSAVAR